MRRTPRPDRHARQLRAWPASATASRDVRASGGYEDSRRGGASAKARRRGGARVPGRRSPSGRSSRWGEAKPVRPAPGRGACPLALVGKSSTAQLPKVRTKRAPAGAILPARYPRPALADRRPTHPLPPGSGCVGRSSRASGRFPSRGHRCPPPGALTRGAWGRPVRARAGCPSSGRADWNRFCTETKSPARRDLQVPVDRLASSERRDSRAGRQGGGSCFVTSGKR